MLLELERAKSAAVSADLLHSKEERQRMVDEKEKAKQEMERLKSGRKSTQPICCYTRVGLI